MKEVDKMLKKIKSFFKMKKIQMMKRRRIKNFKKRILKLQKVKDEMRRKSSLDLPLL